MALGAFVLGVLVIAAVAGSTWGWGGHGQRSQVDYVPYQHPALAYDGHYGDRFGDVFPHKNYYRDYPSVDVPMSYHVLHVSNPSVALSGHRQRVQHP